MNKFTLLALFSLMQIFLMACQDLPTQNRSKSSEQESISNSLNFLGEKSVPVMSYTSQGVQVVDTLQMVWNDEFNGNVLDDTKWSAAPEWYRQGGSYWSKNNYEMTGNGQVKLKVTQENGNVYAGAIRTHKKFDKKYGYFETRCKIPEIQGGWAAFWMMPYGNQPGNSGNDGTEIDIFESINGWRGKIQHALHWDGYGADHKHASQSMDRPDLYDGAYHKFGVMWTPEEYIFYIDNVETWRTTAGGVADVNQYLKLTMEISGDTWPGNWANQNPKNIDWLVDYVRVYDYQRVDQPEEPSEPLSLSFETLNSGTTYPTGDSVAMDVVLAGDISDTDELQFLVRKGDGEFELVKTIAVGANSIYSHNWVPSEAGSYSLRVTANQANSYVTHVVTSVTIESTVEPFDMSYANLKWGMEYNTGDPVNMDVLLTGDLSEMDALQFMTMNEGETSWTQHDLISVSHLTEYSYDWIPTEAGVYKVRVTARKKGAYVDHVVVSDINVNPAVVEPFDIHYTTLTSGVVAQKSDGVVMDVNMTGDLSEVDELKFVTMKAGETTWTTHHTTPVAQLASYSYTWSPSEPGVYKVRVTARKNNNYHSHVVVNEITILEPFDIQFANLSSGETIQLAGGVVMDVNLSGDLSEVDELRYKVKKDGGSWSNVHIVNVSDPNSSTYTWSPSEPGTYAFKVTAKKAGNYVTHVVVNSVQIEAPVLEPVNIQYRVLENNSTYAVGSQIKMHVDVTGDISLLDKIKFVVQKSGGSDIVIKETNYLDGLSVYYKKWTPSEPGEYKLKAQAYKEGQFVTHQVVTVTIY